jgi:hypothetical protein
MAGDEIDHLEASHPQSNITLDEETFVVGSAMNQSSTHPLDVIYRYGAISVVIDNSGDATHRFASSRFEVLSSRLGGSRETG